MEAEFIAWLNAQSLTEPEVFGDFTDDAAILSVNEHTVVTTDAITEDVDFILDEATPDQIGYKAVMVNASDIAAMGATPTEMLVNLVIPKHWSLASVKSLYAGIRHAAFRCNCKVIGGDYNSWEHGLVVTITMFGALSHSTPLTRAGASPGDLICVSGPLGGSILGHHLSFAPRIGLPALIAQYLTITSCMDISDGLSCDLPRLCAASDAGAKLFAERIPITQAARRLADRDGQSVLDHALHDGEDFELLYTITPVDLKTMDIPSSLMPALNVIGEITKSRDVVIHHNSQVAALESRGFLH